jgi:two-component system OmpR family sensor kinase
MAIATNADLVQPTDAAGTSEGLLQSGPAAEEPRSPRARRAPRIPLRITLVALMALLVALGLGATGLTATSLLRDYLTEQQDAALTYGLHTAQQRPDILQACRQGLSQRAPNGTYYACLPPDSDTLIVVLGPPDDGDLPEVTAPTAEDLAESDVTTVQSVDGGTDWRLIGGSLTGGWTVVIGSDISRDQAAIERLVTIEVVVGLIVLVVLAAAGYGLVRNSLRPLTEVEHTARAIAAGDLSRRVPEGSERTEVGRLSAALNGMLARIESSFRAQQASEAQARASEDRMRRFVADASHELRTPLTSIRGFAELYRQGAVRSPEDTRRLMQRIESEGARMGLLVEDLLQLARLDQQRPLTIVPVDLAEIAGDAVHDARAVQPERPISLHLDESLTDFPVVLGDEARLRQVVSNLFTNAITHTPEPAKVTDTVAEDADPDVLVIRVADEGPGMAPADAERVFERFYRADTSRTREGGGTGLGLAIVASLVAAHGGTVDLQTAPGEGAVFSVRLRRSGPEE